MYKINIRYLDQKVLVKTNYEIAQNICEELCIVW